MAKHITRSKVEPTLTIAPSLSQIDAAGWDACANPNPGEFNPFVSHAYLHALERSGCVGMKSGWIPRHLALTDFGGEICALMPCYVKTHSRGEYVFDHAWAEAMERAGGSYYPKLQCAVPFTPVTGPRILTKPGPDTETYERILIRAAIDLTDQMGLSSLHITFMQEQQNRRLETMGLLKRTDQQFHWHNNNYQSFEAFLDTLSSRKRKAVRKERKKALDQNIEIEHLQAGAITDEHWDVFYQFYLNTADRKWGTPYLNRAFFKQLGDTMAARCLLIMAKRKDRYIAGALNLIGGDCLYGRYWGEQEHVPCLHFEVCYYQAIDYAIKHGLARVEAGAQGEHKLARGYSPATTYSAHWFKDQGLHAAIERYLKGERRHVEHIQDMLMDMTPYKKTDTTNKNR